MLRGARATLRAHRPVVCLELHFDELERRGESAGALLEDMASMGYRFESTRGGALPLWRLRRSLMAIARVVAHVDANLTSSLQVDRLATIAEMSRGHFVRQFAAATGLAPSEFVLERRIERIERLLLATDMSVVAIARATGFADANYLGKAFRRKRGVAPLEYRATRRLAAGT